MKDARLVFGQNVVPLKAPIDSGSTAWDSIFVDLRHYLHATFYVYFGVVTATSADQAVVVTMEASTTSASGAEVQIPFKYRVSAATGTNTWGAVTAATAAGGATIATTDDGKLLAIDLDPAVMEGLLTDARYVRLHVGIDAGGTVTLNAAWAELEPAYASLTHLSTSS